MGSRSTKVAAAPHVQAAASPVAPAQHHVKRNHANESGPCQEVVVRSRGAVVSTKPCDDLDLGFPTRTTTASTRRYSEPAQTAAMTTELNTEGIPHLDAFERFLAERDLMAIDMDLAALAYPVPTEQSPIPPLPVPKEVETQLEEPEVQCIACCTQLPKEKDPVYVREVIKPCRSCNSAYCVSCVKGMFLNACKDSTRMPPRCCMQIHLHHIKPYLNGEEVSEYKAKYEEWSTPKPFFCPVPTCSTFIPDRLLPQQAGTKGKRKVDSGIGTPTSPTLQCPKCEGDICVDCRQVAHPDNLCANLDLGLDADTAALLKGWGYKRCPKCSQGLKRMYGCNHMECRCGAHFCWGCMKSRDECEGGCYEDEDEDEGSNSEPDEPEPRPGSDGDTTMSTETTTTETVKSASQSTESVIVVTAEASQSVPRPRNLDGGRAHYWEQQDLDFGDEPTDDVQDRAWECHHDFEPYTVSLPDAISKHPSMLEMECVKCWRTILPGIETPSKPSTVLDSLKSARYSTGRGRGRGRGRGYGTVARPRPEAYTAPRGLTRSDTTIGTAPHLTAQVSSFPEPPSRVPSDAMEDVQPGPDLKKTSASGSLTSIVFSNPSTTLSIGQECYSCSLLVCRDCADAILVQRETERATRIIEQEASDAVLSAAAAETRAQEHIEVPASPSGDDENDDSSPSIFNGLFVGLSRNP
jgi:hypothetical protein